MPDHRSFVAKKLELVEMCQKLLEKCQEKHAMIKAHRANTIKYSDMIEQQRELAVAVLAQQV